MKLGLYKASKGVFFAVHFFAAFCSKFLLVYFIITSLYLLVANFDLLD